MEILALIIIFLAAVYIQGFLLNFFLFHNLEYSCSFSVDKATEGDSIFLEEIIYNKKPIPISWIKAEIYTSKWLDFAGKDAVIAQESRFVTSNFFLKSYQKTTRRWNVKCLKRGYYKIDKITLVGGDFLGSFSESSDVIDVEAQLLVYPAPVVLERCFRPASRIIGDTIVRRWINDDPFMFSGIREYMPGDALNRIHWKATASRNRLMVKKNDFTANLKTAVVLNIQSRDSEPDEVIDKEYIEFGIKVAATVFDKALKESLPLSFSTNGSIFNEKNPINTKEAVGWEHVNELLGILARLKLKKVQDFEYFINDIYKNYQNTEVIILTSYLTEKICNTIRKIKARKNNVSIILLNAVERENLPGDLDVYIPY
ncbi:DUF58 domain-containing protein [Acetivibrio saccincola]|uniref:DUF58 domain-containing protein n=1 Tax=Acetivibrio saccincola TaxID=1677857 RepID=A0A2K9E414_9FIRM|nr:DUF58 domain-containing protein [Acetivibrio saccincola]AUG58462.1 hypothetical protein HVS_12945 [Acetivibrio saccincola]